MERPRFGYRKAVEAALARQEEETQLRIQKRLTAQDRIQLETTGTIGSIISQLDSLEVPARLEEINQDIWNNRGVITTQDLTSDRADGLLLLGRIVELRADIPRLDYEYQDLTKEVYDTWSTSRTTVLGGEYSTGTESGWVDKKVGTRTFYFEGIDTQGLRVKYSMSPEGKSGKIEVVDYGKWRFDTPETVSLRGKSFKLEPRRFNLGWARSFIEDFLMASNFYRTSHPVEELYQQGQRSLEQLRLKGVSRYFEDSYDPFFKDPTPIINRILASLGIKF